MKNFQETQPGKEWKWEANGKRYVAKYVAKIQSEWLRDGFDCVFHIYHTDIKQDGNVVAVVRISKHIYFLPNGAPMPVIDERFFNPILKTLPE
jgi:hypothetical protein